MDLTCTATTDRTCDHRIFIFLFLQIIIVCDSYFNSNSIEFIKATPCSSLSKPFVNVSNGPVIHLLRTIENINHHSKSPSEIFSSFSLASSSFSMYFEYMISYLLDISTTAHRHSLTWAGRCTSHY